MSRLQNTSRNVSRPGTVLASDELFNNSYEFMPVNATHTEEHINQCKAECNNSSHLPHACPTIADMGDRPACMNSMKEWKMSHEGASFAAQYVLNS
jgi:hypothetical protein